MHSTEATCKDGECKVGGISGRLTRKLLERNDTGGWLRGVVKHLARDSKHTQEHLAGHLLLRKVGEEQAQLVQIVRRALLVPSKQLRLERLVELHSERHGPLLKRPSNAAGPRV